MFSPSNGKLTGPILGLSLAAVATGLYLSPVGHHLPKPNANGSTRTVTQTVTAAPSATASGPSGSPTKTGASTRSGSPNPSGSPGSGSSGAGSSGAGSSGQQRAPRPETTVGQPGYSVNGDNPNLPSDDGPVVDDPGPGGTQPAPGAPQPPKFNPNCSNFDWQQDAQKAYLANLKDPQGLDGLPGDHNDDGLACMQLPRDPKRAASVPAASFAMPTDKASIMKPSTKYFGVSEDTLPGDTGAYEDVIQHAGKAPSLIEFFNTWTDSAGAPIQFNTTDAGKVQKSWKRKAMPVLTWMPERKGGFGTADNPIDQSPFALQNISSGKFDSFLTEYAKEVVANGQPFGIRFAHEMNGNWYPWSAGYNNPDRGIVNTSAMYRAAWQRIWNIFQAQGANEYVVWIWTPIRVNGIDAGHHGYTSLQEDYPGDQYVDWVGTSAYDYKLSPYTKATERFSYTFGDTFAALKALTAKPIFIAETGATAARPTYSNQKDRVTLDVDSNQQKAEFLTDILKNFASDPQVVGLAYFNNRVENVHSLTFTRKDGSKEKYYFTTDWRIQTSVVSQDAFRNAIADQRWGVGIDTRSN